MNTNKNSFSLSLSNRASGGRGRGPAATPMKRSSATRWAVPPPLGTYALVYKVHIINMEVV